MRDTEKKLAEEKSLRETADAKVKALRKALREKEETAQASSMSGRGEDSPSGKGPRIEQIPDEICNVASLSRASSSDSLDFSAGRRPDENQVAPREEQVRKVLSRSDEIRPRNDTSLTPPRPNIASAGSSQFPPKQPVRQSELAAGTRPASTSSFISTSGNSLQPQQATPTLIGAGNRQKDSQQSSWQQNAQSTGSTASAPPNAATMGSSKASSQSLDAASVPPALSSSNHTQANQSVGVASGPSQTTTQAQQLGNTGNGGSTAPLQASQNQPAQQTTQPVASASAKSQVTPQNPFAQGAVPASGPQTASPAHTPQTIKPLSSATAAVVPQQMNKSPSNSQSAGPPANMSQLSFVESTPGSVGEFARPGQNQRNQSTSSQRSLPTDFDPLKPRTQPSAPETTVPQQQQSQFGQVFMMDQQAMAFPIVGLATTDNQLGYPEPIMQFQQQIAPGYGGSYDPHQPGQQQTQYQDVQQMFFVPQHQLAGVDFSHPQMMTIQQPILQLQGTTTFADSMNAGWNQQTYLQAPAPAYASNAIAPQVSIQHNRSLSIGFDPLQPQGIESNSSQNQSNQVAGFDPLQTTPDLYQHQQQHQQAQPYHRRQQSMPHFQQGESAFRAPHQQTTQGQGGDPFAQLQQPQQQSSQQQPQFTGESA